VVVLNSIIYNGTIEFFWQCFCFFQVMTLKKFGHDQTFLIVQFNDQIVLVTQIWQLKIGYKSFVIIKTNLIKKIPYQKT
jgi:hypothetical protein